MYVDLLTCVSAVGVLRGLVRPVVAIKLSVTLPALLLQAAAVSTAELVGATRGVLYTHTNTHIRLQLH